MQRPLSLVPLAAWFSEVRRVFPWRENPTPYRVFVSEVMLQQTQASRVIPFFTRWMTLFETITALADASEESVIKAWEGLGYYSRARALHKAAKMIVENHKGEMPRDEKDLLSLPGVGPYTAGAIRAFAFHERAAAIDANVTRVILRLLEPMPLAIIPSAVEKMLPEERPWYTMEALIELGALVCKPIPDCASCPMMEQCDAFATKTWEDRPRKKVAQRISLWRDVAIFVSQGSVLVTYRSQKQVMSGLYEFPFFETTPQGSSSSSFLKYIQPLVPTSLSFFSSLPKTSHSFTRYHATLYPTIFSCTTPFLWPDSQ